MSDRDENGRWKEGHKGTGGRPIGTNTEVEQALQRAKARHGDVSLLDSVCDRAYKDVPLAIALLKKRYPDLKQVAVIKQYEGGYASDTPAEACRRMDEATIGKKPDGEDKPVGDNG